MSLRGFHYVFIALSALLSWGVAYLEFTAYSKANSLADGIVAGAAALIGVVLLGYGVWFYKKSQKTA